MGEVSEEREATSKRAYMAVLASAFLCYAALGSVIRIIPGYVPDRLGGGLFGVGLAVGAPAISAVLARPLGGRLADRRGPLPIVLAGAVVMAVGAPVALAGTFSALILSRLAVGAGEGLMMSATALWLLRLGGEDRHGRSIGHVGLANYGGLVAGPLLAGILGGQRHPDRIFLLAACLPLLGAGLAALTAPPGGGTVERRGGPLGIRQVLLWVARPGVGLTLVNFGYAALVSFGALAMAQNGAAAGGLVLPVFAGGVILVRGFGGGIPDRLGAERTLALSAPVAGLGLAGLALAAGAPAALASVALLSVGQALAVPALGALALRGVPDTAHGEAAGLFFAFFDAGVGLGGPLAGLAAGLSSAAGALLAAGVLVAIAPIVVLRVHGRTLIEPGASAPTA